MSPSRSGALARASSAGSEGRTWSARMTLRFDVAPVIGATKVPHLESAVESLSVQLTPEDIAYLEEPYVPHPIVGLIPYGGQLLSAQR